MSFKRIEEESGIALIMALWIMTILVMVAASFAFMMRTEIKMATNFRNEMQAHYLARAGIERAIAELINDSDTSIDYLGEAWATIPTVNLGRGRFTVYVEDESGKINLNMNNTTLLRDMIDDDDIPDLTDPSGINIKDYRDGGQMFETYAELEMVTNVGETAMEKCRSYYTIYGDIADPAINVNTTGRADADGLDNNGDGVIDEARERDWGILQGLQDDTGDLTDADCRDVMDYIDTDSNRYKATGNPEYTANFDNALRNAGYFQTTNIGATNGVRDFGDSNSITAAEVNGLNTNNQIRVDSEGYFRIVSTGKVRIGTETIATRKIEAFINRDANGDETFGDVKIYYWRENFPD